MRRLLLAIALVPVSAAASAAIADAAAQGIAKGLADAAGVLAPREHEPKEVYVESDADFPEPAGAVPTETGRATSKQSPVGAKATPRKGLRVSAAKVLRLANAGARPSGVFVPARGERPAGLAMTGVSALGVGLIDGDILTHAGGRPATSTSSIVGMVLGARAKRAPELSGRFWRRGEAWNLLVEQPYIRPKRRPDESKLVTASLSPSRDTETGPNPSKARGSSAPPLPSRKCPGCE